MAEGDVGAHLRHDVLAELERGERGARFAREIYREVRKRQDVAREDFEEALARLEDDGAVLIREQYCEDPHLEGVDLRIVGVVRAQAPRDDPRSACVREIESAWTEWITEYLAEHRCS